MADIKTHLRELSVIVGLGLLSDGTIHKSLNELENIYSSREFYKYCQQYIDNVELANNILTIDIFSDELKSIINNGSNLAYTIFNSNQFEIGKKSKFIWSGNDTQKGNPIDIQINNYKFSLKEDSFILENMGLYQLLNYLTGSNYRRGLHIFNEFAKKEYDDWFYITWQKFIKYLQTTQQWLLIRNNDKSLAKIKNDQVILTFNKETSIIPITIKTNDEYMQYTTSKTREKVFSKWINNTISQDGEYIKLKKKCSDTAGKSLSDKINKEYSASNIYSFFRILPYEYYYAKSNNNITTILRVPSANNFNNSIKFLGCKYDNPISQLNIISSFENVNTKKVLEFRNECRFSHGQFNGTPEAKMYIVRNSPITELYEPII